MTFAFDYSNWSPAPLNLPKPMMYGDILVVRGLVLGLYKKRPSSYIIQGTYPCVINYSDIVIDNYTFNTNYFLCLPGHYGFLI